MCGQPCDTAVVRAYLATAPVWVQSVIAGVLFGGCMTIWQAFRGNGSWPLWILLGVLAGVFFGAFIGRMIKRDFGGSRTELAALPLDQRRAAMRAAARGPAPADAKVRRAALRQAEAARRLLQRRWRFNLVVFSVAVVGYAALALTTTPWWWAAFAMFAALLAGQFASRRRLDRRIAVLAADGDPVAR